MIAEPLPNAMEVTGHSVTVRPGASTVTVWGRRRSACLPRSSRLSHVVYLLGARSPSARMHLPFCASATQVGLFGCER